MRGRGGGEGGEGWWTPQAPSLTRPPFPSLQVWVHDYHLLVLPSLLRKRLHRARVGLFLHSPFPSSEIFRAFPRREEILRSMLNADLVGFHTFDYARHFLSCCSRMLGIEHVTSRGSIGLDYYGRTVGLKIMPTGVKPDRFLDGVSWPDTAWRAGELASQLEGQTVLLGVDDLDAFKGIELKMLAVERVLDAHPEWRGRLTLVQVSNAPRGGSADVDALVEFLGATVARVNGKYGAPAPTPAALVGAGPGGGSGGPAASPPPPAYAPIVWLQRTAPLYERVALYTVADVVVVTATRDGMNLVPYEYVVCRQGAAAARAAGGGGGGGARAGSTGAPSPPATSTLVVSEFVGCSPSLSGAMRVNPWSVDAVADALYAAVTLPPAEAALRHEKHWRYVSSHTVKFWAQVGGGEGGRRGGWERGAGARPSPPVPPPAQSFAADLRRLTAGHVALKCYGLGLGLDSFRCVALTSAFRRLDPAPLAAAYARAPRRLFLLDYDGTLTTAASVSAAPSAGTLATLRALAADPRNAVYIVSGRARAELGAWFADVPGLGIAAEHGYYWREAAGGGGTGSPRAVAAAAAASPLPALDGWRAAGDPAETTTWREVVLPILRLYTESTDGSWVEEKETAAVWHYGDADPDFGGWQAKELLDHLEGVLSCEPVDAVAGAGIVEVKPRGVSKGGAAERVLAAAAAGGTPPTFILCVGDDRSDEDMFAAMEHATFSPHVQVRGGGERREWRRGGCVAPAPTPLHLPPRPKFSRAPWARSRRAPPFTSTTRPTSAPRSRCSRPRRPPRRRPAAARSRRGRRARRRRRRRGGGGRRRRWTSDGGEGGRGGGAGGARWAAAGAAGARNLPARRRLSGVAARATSVRERGRDGETKGGRQRRRNRHTHAGAPPLNVPCTSSAAPPPPPPPPSPMRASSLAPRARPLAAPRRPAPAPRRAVAAAAKKGGGGKRGDKGRGGERGCWAAIGRRARRGAPERALTHATPLQTSPPRPTPSTARPTPWKARSTRRPRARRRRRRTRRPSPTPSRPTWRRRPRVWPRLPTTPPTGRPPRSRRWPRAWAGRPTRRARRSPTRRRPPTRSRPT